MGEVLAVHLNPEHTFSKISQDLIELHEGLGVVADAHYGATVKHRGRLTIDPAQPNLRQVHLMHVELFDDLAEAGFVVGPGDLGENITTRGIDVLALPVGARLTIGTAVLTVTGLRNPCEQINAFQSGLLKQVVYTADDGTLMRLAGIMATVARTGEIRPGDVITVELPPPPHFPLSRV